MSEQTPSGAESYLRSIATDLSNDARVALLQLIDEKNWAMGRTKLLENVIKEQKAEIYKLRHL